MLKEKRNLLIYLVELKIYVYWKNEIEKSSLVHLVNESGYISSESKQTIEKRTHQFVVSLISYNTSDTHMHWF